MAKENRKTKPLILIGAILAILCVLFGIFMYSPLFQVELATKESHIEAGTKAETNPKFYLSGNDFSIFFSYVDTSFVKSTKVGRYPVYIHHGFRKYTSYVNVTDTTAPTVTCDVKTKTIEPGETISVHSLGLKTKDCSDIESIKFTKISSTHFYTGLPDDVTEGMREAYKNGIPMEAEQFQFAYGGIYTLTISVTDAFYNTSDITLNLIVEEGPVIEIPNNFYVANVNEINFLNYVKVWDFISGEMDTKDVVVDISQLNLSKAGTYPVVLSATDDYGLTGTKTIKVHVSSPEALQELINTHVADLSKDVIIGAKNAYDSGYYTTEDIHFIQEQMLPSIVHIENDSLETFGSGFIIEITDDFVTIATNEHVITNDLTVDVTFFDGITRNGAVVAADVKRDIAFIRIPIDGNNDSTSLSSDYVKKLRTVHINKGYWDKLADDCYLTIGYNCIDTEGKIWQTLDGYIVEKEAIRDWNQYKNIKETIISMPPVPGTSGSALFDGYGRLVGMIRGYTHYDTYTETVAVPLSEILTYFEYIFKHKVHYQ